VEHGVDVVVATPHVRPDLPSNDSRLIASRTALLGKLIDAHRLPLRVVAGAEVDLAHACTLNDTELAALTLGDGPWLLVEAPLKATAVDAEVLLGLLRSRGHRVVIAHPERSAQFLRRPEWLRALVADGVLTQVTASALTGAFGSPVRRFARWMVEERLAHVVASDAHDTVRRTPGMLDHLEQAGLADIAPWVTSELPAAILAGQTAVPRPPAPANQQHRRPPRLRGRP
jgi:protein-tyrosine phosphatase